MRYLISIVSLSVLLSTGCGDGDSPPPSGAGTTSASASSASTNQQDSADSIDDTPAASPSSEIPADTDRATATSSDSTGSFRGIVSFQGDVPAPVTIQATKDKEVCSAGEGEVQDVIVTDGRLAGAVVELTLRGKDLPAFKAPDEGFVIRQKDCLFSPRLLVAYTGAELVVHNDDKVEHNVNTGEWNLLQAPGSQPIQKQVNYGGTPFTRVTCNIHSWMESWVYVARSPFYAASNEKGEFVIEGIPAGKKVRGTITHATLGRQRFTVEIAAGETTEQNFEFEAK